MDKRPEDLLNAFYSAGFLPFQSLFSKPCSPREVNFLPQAPLVKVKDAALLREAACVRARTCVLPGCVGLRGTLTVVALN